MYERVDFGEANPEKQRLMLVLTSDRGLCGSVHSNVVKNVRSRLQDMPSDAGVKIVTVGDKARSLLQVGPQMFFMFLSCKSVEES